MKSKERKEGMRRKCPIVEKERIPFLISSEDHTLISSIPSKKTTLDILPLDSFSRQTPFIIHGRPMQPI